jgi:hypothetical protein
MNMAIVTFDKFVRYCPYPFRHEFVSTRYSMDSVKSKKIHHQSIIIDIVEQLNRALILHKCLPIMNMYDSSSIFIDVYIHDN